MRVSPSSSPNSSANITSLNKRLKTIFKKAYELSILCEIEVCVIYFGPDGKLKTWPGDREKVIDMALRYKAATKRKKSLDLHELEKKKKKNNVNRFKYPIFDHYSPKQLSQLIQSLEQTLSTLQERLRFVEAQKQRNMNFAHQTKPLNPSQFSLYIYNHGDATLSQLPLSTSHSNQLTNYQNQLMMQQKLHGFDPCVSNTQDYSALLSAQESELKNHLMQKQQQELHGFDQNKCMMSDITNSNVLQHPCLSNTVSDVFFSDFQKNPNGDMVGSTSYSQDFPNMFSSYDESSLLQTSSLPSLHTIPNTYCLSDNSRFL